MGSAALCTKGEPTIITCEMFFVFGCLRTSSMKYLSPSGVCLTVASNTEQSASKIGDHLDIVGTWRTWTFAWDLLNSDISWVGQVRLGASHNCMVWIFLAVRCAL